MSPLMTSRVTALHSETARPSLLRVDETTDENAAEVTVTLQFKGDRHVGRASGDPSAAFRPSLVATAALRAVDSAGHGDHAVVATSIAKVGGLDVAIVIIDDLSAGRALVGAAVIEEDIQQIAFAKASLDGTNRCVHRLP